MQIPFCGPSYTGRSRANDPSRCINFYVEIAESSTGKSQVILVGTPGTRTFVSFQSGEIRLVYNFSGRLFVVSGNLVYEVFSSGAKIVRGFLPTTTGYISAVDNGTDPLMANPSQILMITNGFGYIFNIDNSTVTKITDPGFPINAYQAEYLDGYFIVTRSDSRQFYVSEIYNGLVWPGLAVASVLATPDNIQTVKELHQHLFFFKEASIELFYNAGIATQDGCPFVKLQGTVINYGTPSSRTVAKGADTIIFLGNIRNADLSEFVGVCGIEGYQAQVLSPPSITYRISKFTHSDAFAYVYNDEGHIFYVITFPTDDVTFVCDLTTKLWHERSTSNNIDNNTHRHLSEYYTFFNGKHLVSDYRSSLLLEMSSDIYDDDGLAIVSERIAQPIFDNQNLNGVTIHRLVIDLESGNGGSSVVPQDPSFSWFADGIYYADGVGFAGGFNLVTNLDVGYAWLSWSNDGGYNWTNEYSCSVGLVGEYGKRLSWRCIGRARNKTFKLRMPDGIKKVLLGAYINDGSIYNG